MNARITLALATLLPLVGCASAGNLPELRAPDAATLGGPLGELREDAACFPEAPPPWDAEAHLAGGQPRHEPAPKPQPPADDGADLSKLLAERPKLRVPSRLAVVEAWRPWERVHVPAWGSPRLDGTGGAWALRPPLPAALQELRAGLDASIASETGAEWPKLEGPRQDPFAAIDPIPGLLLPVQATLTGARRAAARVGADVVLVYATAGRVYAWRNGWANFYPTLVGLVLPGEERAALVRAEAALVDVRTGAVLAVAQAEAREGSIHAPLIGGGPEAESALVEEASARAVAGVAGELRRALLGLEAAGRFAPAGEGAK